MKHNYKHIIEIIKKKFARTRRKLKNKILGNSDQQHLVTPPILSKKNKVSLIKIHENISRDLLCLNKIDYRITTTKVVNTENIIYYNKYIPLDYIKLVFPLEHHHYDFIVTIKTFRTGGTDKLLIRYLTGIQHAYPTKKIILLVLDGVEGAWDNKLPNNVTLLRWQRLTKQPFSQEKYNRILSKLIIQYHIDILWNFNCRETYLFIEQCNDFIINNVKVWGLVFAHWLKPGNLQEFGMAHENLPFVIDSMEYIISDNSTFCEYICEQYGWDRKKFITLYVPNSDLPLSHINFSSSNSLKVVWASGIEWNKGIELLPKIAKGIINLPITIDVYGSTKNKEGENLLLKLMHNIKNSPNIAYKGTFSNFSQLIKDEKYNCFLFTSFIEGMPNVIIEAAEHQLSIVTPIVGGLGEFLDEENAYLVNDKTDEVQYIEQLIQVLEDIKHGNFDKHHKLKEVYNTKFTISTFCEQIKVLLS